MRRAGMDSRLWTQQQPDQRTRAVCRVWPTAPLRRRADRPPPRAARPRDQLRSSRARRPACIAPLLRRFQRPVVTRAAPRPLSCLGSADDDRRDHHAAVKDEHAAYAEHTGASGALELSSSRSSISRGCAAQTARSSRRPPRRATSSSRGASHGRRARFAWWFTVPLSLCTATTTRTSAPASATACGPRRRTTRRSWPTHLTPEKRRVVPL